MFGEFSQAKSTQLKPPALSLILCSRNDEYMGNSRWRLETVINYVADRVSDLGRGREVEVLVADWGSETPLRDVLRLSSVAARMVSFLFVPPGIARALQKDSPFPEVLALNAAARRARGAFIGRIDQDTLVGSEFLKFFFELYEGKRQIDVPAQLALFFANQRMVPFRFTVRNPSLRVVEKLICWFGQALTMEHRNSRADFYTAGVGIWLLHRDLWHESGGYDERMIYMNGMETNMVRRLLLKHEIVNLGKLVSYDFYHLEHYHPLTVRKSSTHRKVNPRFPYSQPKELHPNAESWGLAEYDLPLLASIKGEQAKVVDSGSSISGVLAFLYVMLRVGPELGLDYLRTVSAPWTRRMHVVWGTVKRKPIYRWPHLLRKLWVERYVAQRFHPEVQRKPFKVNGRGGENTRRIVIRRAFYSLPARWQLPVKNLKRALLRQYDWADVIKRLRVDEEKYLNGTSLGNRSLPNRQRVAMFSLHHFSPVEYGLAMALRLRGHDVQGILCDGLLPLCEMNLGPNIRPPCEACIMNLSRYEDAFGFHYDRLKDFVSEEDHTRAENLVAETPEEARPTLTVNGVPVGRFARREIQRYYRGFIFDPSHDPAFRKWLVSAVLLTWLSERWLDRIQPDILGVCSGRTLGTACVFQVARSRGISVVTWDGTATRPDTLMFSHNQSATEIPLDDAWETAATRELSTFELNELTEFLGRWSRSENTPYPYNPKPVTNPATIRETLGLRGGIPLIVAFTNTSWDIAVIDRDVVFESMFDWLFALVEYAVVHPEIDLVVRAHPAEKNVPEELQSRTPVAAEIRKRFQPLARNIKLIEGDNPISSYSLANMAQVNMVYASRLGLEIALGGKRPWIAGAVTYRGKGFTLDLESKDHMYRLLDQKAFENRLSKEEVELAQRFAYLWFFRYEVRLPLLHPPDKRFALSTFRELGPGGDPVLDNLCQAIVTGEPFVDMGVPKPRSKFVPDASVTARALLHNQELAR